MRAESWRAPWTLVRPRALHLETRAGSFTCGPIRRQSRKRMWSWTLMPNRPSSPTSWRRSLSLAGMMMTPTLLLSPLCPCTSDPMLREWSNLLNFGYISICLFFRNSRSTFLSHWPPSCSKFTRRYSVNIQCSTKFQVTRFKISLPAVIFGNFAKAFQ